MTERDNRSRCSDVGKSNPFLTLRTEDLKRTTQTNCRRRSVSVRSHVRSVVFPLSPRLVSDEESRRKKRFYVVMFLSFLMVTVIDCL